MRHLKCEQPQNLCVSTHSPGRRQVYRCQRRAGSVLQSRTGPAAAGSHTDTWSAGSPLGSAGWRPSTAPSMSDRPAQSNTMILNLCLWTLSTVHTPTLHKYPLNSASIKTDICKYGYTCYYIFTLLALKSCFESSTAPQLHLHQHVLFQSWRWSQVQGQTNR